MKFIRKSYELHSDKKKSGKEISIVLLSDLHLAEYGKDNIQLIEEIREIHPDVIVSTGDMVTARQEHDTEVAEKLFQVLCKEYPVYYAPGNHEERLKVRTDWFGNRYSKYCKKLEEIGVNLLQNERVEITAKDTSICIYGLELPLSYFQRMSRVSLEEQVITDLIGKPEKEVYNILLAHHPRFAETYFAWGADLILSGHVHGGIMRLGNRACISPDLSIFPHYGYGRFDRGHQTMLVSSGLGEHTIPFRIFNPKELVHIVIK